MIEIINRSTDPYFNLALEEYAVKNMPGKDNYFILWQNQPAVIIGRNQNTAEEINESFIKEQKIRVARRMSGGGAVYHDAGNLNFTFVVNENKDFANFQKFTRPIIKALDKIGITAENNGRNDISIAGKKFSGNAQFKFHKRLLHHGTILFDSNIEDMVVALNPGDEKIISKGIKSVRSRVTNISEHLSTPLSVKEFKQILTETVLMEESDNKTYKLSDEDNEAVNQLRNQKYSNWDWIYGASPAYNSSKKGTFPWGSIDIRLDVKHGLIKECKIFGDFFARRDIEELQFALIGTPYREEEIRKTFSRIDVKDYLPQSDNDEIIKLLCNNN